MTKTTTYISVVKDDYKQTKPKMKSASFSKLHFESDVCLNAALQGVVVGCHFVPHQCSKVLDPLKCIQITGLFVVKKYSQDACFRSL